jgi:aminopeptidase N
MDWFFDQWVYGTGIPTYKVAWQAEPVVDNWHVTLRIDQERVPPDFLMYVPVLLELEDKTSVRVRVKVTGARSEIRLPPVPARPKRVKFNDLEGVLADVKELPW